MKFTKEQLLLAIEDLKNFATDSYDDAIGEDFEDPVTFLRACCEVLTDITEENES